MDAGRSVVQFLSLMRTVRLREPQLFDVTEVLQQVQKALDVLNWIQYDELEQIRKTVQEINLWTNTGGLGIRYDNQLF